MLSRPRSRRVLGTTVATAALLALAGAAYLAVPRRPVFHGTTYDEATAAPGFTLVDHTGRRATLADFRGKPVLLFFGYTHCPDVCPLTMGKLARITSSLGSRAEDLRILLVTTDPERDTPAALAAYVRRFTPQAVGLTGDSTALRQAFKGYGVYTLPDEHGGHGTMTHSQAVYGIDREGRLQVVMDPGTREEELRDDVRALLSL